jgi:DNA (cytosine-5)-methyltransferase 1
MQNQTALSPLRCNPLFYGSLFAGVGGFDLGFDRAGLKCAWQVEIDPFARKVLEKHWPGVPKHDDIRTFQPTTVDVVCGGFPCQDISNAGKKAGIAEGTRSGLWSEYVRIVRTIRPRFVVVENVSALLVRGLDRVLGDLAASGYDAEWDCFTASAFGAPHERERLFLIAYPSESVSVFGSVFDAKHEVPRNEQWSSAKNIQSGRRWKRWLGEAAASVDGQVSASDFSGMDDGFSKDVDRIGACGNAVVPAIAEWIGQRIVEAVGVSP